MTTRGDDTHEIALEHKTKRIKEAVMGIAFVVAGIWVFLKSPEHGAVPAMLLIGFGCLMIDRKLATSLFRLRGGGDV